jgi:urease accessory protein
MLDTIAPTIVTPMQRARGSGKIAAKYRQGQSALDRLYQQGCAKLRVPKTHSDALQGVLINSSGGLTDGDHIDWHARAGAGSHLVMTTQACERVYRSLGGPAHVATTLEIEAGARLDWLPQETILFDGSSLSRSLEVNLGGDAVFLGLEAVIIGRDAHGDAGDGAALADTWRVWREGRLVHAEATRLGAGDLKARGASSLLDGARAFGTLLYVASDAERKLGPLRTVLGPCATAGASLLGDKLVLRAMAPSGYLLRKIMMPAIAALTRENTVPRLWML